MQDHERILSMMRAVVWIAGILIGLGGVSGGLFALVAIILGRDLPGAVDLVVTLYDSLAVLMTAALWAALYLRRDDADYRAAYATLGRAVGTGLQGATLGALLGAGPVFLTAAGAVAGWSGVPAADTFGAELSARVVWAELLFVAAVTIGSALPLAMWTHYTGPGREP